MTQSKVSMMEHTIEVAAPPERVFAIIADVEAWPRVFPPTVHVDRIEQDGERERIQIWATANGEVKGWTSQRRIDYERLSATFRQEVSQPPVAAMGGEWIVESEAAGRCRVRLLHDFRAVDDDPDRTEWIRRAVDRNSGAELSALKVAAELEDEHDGTLMSFEDSVRVAGASGDLYDFINDAASWERRLPHAQRVQLAEPAPGVQELEMDTLAPDGSTHTTMSVRICFPSARIVYKQLRTPALLAAHTGCWSFTADGDHAVVTSAHTVVLRPEAIGRVLGPDATLADARTFVRNALGRNSTATMQHAKAYAERPARSYR